MDDLVAPLTVLVVELVVICLEVDFNALLIIDLKKDVFVGYMYIFQLIDLLDR